MGSVGTANTLTVHVYIQTFEEGFHTTVVYTCIVYVNSVSTVCTYGHKEQSLVFQVAQHSLIRNIHLETSATLSITCNYCMAKFSMIMNTLLQHITDMVVAMQNQAMNVLRNLVTLNTVKLNHQPKQKNTK